MTDIEFLGAGMPEYAVGGAKQRDLRRVAPAGKRRSVVVSSDLERDRESVTDMVQCCHCQRCWQWVRGSGRLRGYCFSCDGITCGPTCPVQGCVPWQQLLENLEAGMTWGEACRHKPVRARVEAAPPVSRGGVLLGK